MTTFRTAVILILDLYSLVLLARGLASWVDPDARSPLSQVLMRLTEPVLRPVRRVLPSTRGIDFSPIVVFVVLMILSRLIGLL